MADLGDYALPAAGALLAIAGFAVAVTWWWTYLLGRATVCGPLPCGPGLQQKRPAIAVGGTAMFVAGGSTLALAALWHWSASRTG